MHTAFPERRPCCVCMAALGREHTSASMGIKGAVKPQVPVTYPVHELVLYIFHAWFLPAENIAVLRWWVVLWALLNRLMKSSTPAHSSPALVPDDRPTALDPFLWVALIHSQKTWGSGLKLKQERLGLDRRKKLFLWGWWGIGTGCPEKLQLLHPCKCSRPGRMGFGATWSSGRCPCPEQRSWRVPLNPGHSIIQLNSESTKIKLWSLCSQQSICITEKTTVRNQKSLPAPK